MSMSSVANMAKFNSMEKHLGIISDNEWLDRLQLIRSQNVGLATFLPYE